MNIITKPTTVANSSSLPTFDAVFPSLIEPSKIVLQDKFESNVGNLDGRSLEKVNNAQKWLALGSGGKTWKVSGDGYAYTGSPATPAVIITQHMTVGHVYAAMEFGGGNTYFGIVVRYFDPNNYVRALLTYAGGLVLEAYVDGVKTTIGSAAVTMTAGKIYHLGVKYTTTGVQVAVDNVVKINTESNESATNTGVGLLSSSSTHKVWEFVAG